MPVLVLVLMLFCDLAVLIINMLCRPRWAICDDSKRQESSTQSCQGRLAATLPHIAAGQYYILVYRCLLLCLIWASSHIYKQLF